MSTIFQDAHVLRSVAQGRTEPRDVVVGKHAMAGTLYVVLVVRSNPN